MSWLSFKFLIIFLFILSSFVKAQKDFDTTLFTSKKPALKDALIPKYTKIQYAGLMGMFSFGGGWLYGKNRWETDLLVGFAPTLEDRPTLFTITLKQNYTPWKIKLNNQIIFEPLSTGCYLNVLLNDKEIFARNPSRFPDGYYWHSEKYRFNAFVGERLMLKLKKKNSFIKSIIAFYEFSVCDLYVINTFKNNYIKPKDYISLSIGIGFQFI